MPLGDKINFINSIILLCGHRHNKRYVKLPQHLLCIEKYRQYILHLNGWLKLTCFAYY